MRAAPARTVSAQRRRPRCPTFMHRAPRTRIAARFIGMARTLLLT